MRPFIPALVLSASTLLGIHPVNAVPIEDQIEQTVAAFLNQYTGEIPPLTAGMARRSVNSTLQAWRTVGDAQKGATITEFLEARTRASVQAQEARLAILATESLRARMGVVESEQEETIYEMVGSVRDSLGQLARVVALDADDPVAQRLVAEHYSIGASSLTSLSSRSSSAFNSWSGASNAAKELWKMITSLQAGKSFGSFAAPPPRQISDKEMARREKDYEEWMAEQKRQEIEKRRLESERAREELARRQAPPPETPTLDDAAETMSAIEERRRNALDVPLIPPKIQTDMQRWYDYSYLQAADATKAELRKALQAPAHRPNDRLRACAKLVRASGEILTAPRSLRSPVETVNPILRGLYEKLAVVGTQCAEGKELAPLMEELQPFLQGAAEALAPYKLTP